MSLKLYAEQDNGGERVSDERLAELVDMHKSSRPHFSCDLYSALRELQALRREAQALRASRPAASPPLREAAELVLDAARPIEPVKADTVTISYSGGSKLVPEWALHDLRAALAVPALRREELRARLVGLCSTQMLLGKQVGFDNTMGVDVLAVEREERIAAILDAVCGPEASHG